MPEKPLEYAASLLKRGTEIAKQQARALALQGQVLRLRGEKERLLLRMGQKVYALFEQELVKNADLLALCREARELDREIAEREAEIEHLRAGREEAPEGGTAEPGAAPAPPPPPGTDLGDAFLRDGMPPASPPAAEELAPAAEATPGADPTAEPPFLAELEPAPVELHPEGDPTREIPLPAEPPAAEATPGADPTQEPPATLEAPEER